MQIKHVDVRNGQGMVPGDSRGRRALRWAALAAAVLATGTAWGDIAITGEVSPGDPATWTSGTTGYIGNILDGSVTIHAGSDLLAGTVYVGNATGSSGTVLVEGSGSTWTCGNMLYIGNSGSGVLEIANRGAVSNSYAFLGRNLGATGAVTVDGIGSTWNCTSALEVGYFGSGALNITGGGYVSTTADCFLGHAGGSLGTLTVSGGSLLNCTYGLNVGNYGTGICNLLGGGQVNSGDGYLGHLTGSAGTMTVDGSGSKWNCGKNLYLGGEGPGVLQISNGGVVAVGGYSFGGNAYIASPSGSLRFGANGGTLTAETFYGNAAQITGSGTILTRGIVTDESLVFNAAHAADQTLIWGSGPQQVTVHLDVTGDKGYFSVNFGAGYLNTGSLTIREGATVSCYQGFLGFNPGASGVAMVNGSGSTWTCSSTTCVGRSGWGTLNIMYGGQVNDGYQGIAGYFAGSVGTVWVEGSGAAWTCGSLLFVGYYGAGAATVTRGGQMVSGGGQLGFYSGSDGQVTVEGSGSAWTCNQDMSVGGGGTGRMLISNGGQVSNAAGYVGHDKNSAGTVTVTGSGALWTCNGDLGVGYRGNGVLRITHGGQVSNIAGGLGSFTGAAGIVLVQGEGSRWTCSGGLALGGGGTGTLTITGGGTVTALGVGMNSGALLAMMVGDKSLLNAGMGAMSTAGIIRLMAAPNATTGVYTPIVAAGWSGFGTVQAVGGFWNATTHTFTIYAPQNGTSGEAVTINTLTAQSVAITDPTSGRRVTAGFQGTSVSAMLTVSAVPEVPAESALLVLAPDQEVLAGWQLTTSGYKAGNPVLLAMEVGAGYALEDLKVWHYDGTAWGAFATGDLAYDGGSVSFTVKGFSGYAVTGPAAVPEAGTLGVLGLGVAGLLGRRRRTKRGELSPPP